MYVVYKYTCTCHVRVCIGTCLCMCECTCIYPSGIRDLLRQKRPIGSVKRDLYMYIPIWHYTLPLRAADTGAEIGFGRAAKDALRLEKILKS